MKQKGQITAFYIETLIMITVMMGILLVLSQILGISRKESIQARRLTQAVTIAQSAAEAASSAGDLDSFQEALDLESFEILPDDGDGQICQGLYHWEGTDRSQGSAAGTQALAAGSYRVWISRVQAEGLYTDTIRIYPAARVVEIFPLSVVHGQ